MVVCSEKPPVRLLWCWLLFVIHCCSSFTDVFTFPSYFSMPPALHPGFAGLWRSPPALSTTLVTFDCFCFFIQRYDCKWELFTHRNFLPYPPFPNIFDTNLLLSRPHWEPAVLPRSLQGFMMILETQTWPICLIHNNPQSSYIEEFVFKPYKISSWITCGKGLVHLLLTCFELFSLVQSHM